MSAYPIPVEALANHIAILGKTGSGKSNAAKTLAEQALDRSERVCVIDPTGTWYGLRLTRKGKPSPYKVVIFGGKHGDLPIGAAHGAAIAETVGTTSTPAVIDTRLMTVGDRTRFFTDFAEALLRTNQGPLTLIIDEAHLFAPQSRVNDPKSSAMVHAANNLVSLGRGLGLRIVLISQRPAKLHKDSLTQVETLVAMRLIAPQDRDAVREWIKEAANLEQGKEIIASLSSLPTGDAWVWSPEIGVLHRGRFPLASTFDSGSAPATGEAGPALAALDLKAVTVRLEQVAADVVANDPKVLRAEIARLKADAAKAPQLARNPGELKDAEQRGYERGHDDGSAQVLNALGGIAADLAASLGAAKEQCERSERLLASFGTFTEAMAREPRTAPVLDSAPSSEAPKISRQARSSPAPKSTLSPAAAGSVPAGCAKPLAALAAVYPSGLTEAQWSTAAGYKRSGGTWGTYKSRLRGAGLIELRDGRWFATAAGAEAAGDVEMPPPPGPDLVRWWAAKLPGTTRMAEALIEAWPQALDRDDLAARLEMAAGGGSFGTYLSRLAGPGLIERSGRTIRLSPDAMGT